MAGHPGQTACTIPEGLAVVVHDDGKVGRRLLQLQQPEHRGQEAVRNGRVLPGCRRQALRAKAKVRAVQQCVRIHEDEPGLQVTLLTHGARGGKRRIGLLRRSAGPYACTPLVVNMLWRRQCHVALS